MLAFVHIEKCGGTTLVHTLRRAFGLDHFDVLPRDKSSHLFTSADLAQVLRLRPRVKSLAGHSIRLRSRLERVVPEVRYYTLLRDPVRRYVSDFYHFVDLLGFPDDFEHWLSLTDRHDFQTRAIAGTADVAAAKELLTSRFAAVGIVEEYDTFLDSLAGLAHPRRLEHRSRVRNAADQRRGRHGKVPLERFRDAIIARNRLDLELYDHVRRVILPEQEARRDRGGGSRSTGAARTIFGSWRGLQNLLFRNLIYKPYLGYLPFRPHALPRYRRSVVRER